MKIQAGDKFNKLTAVKFIEKKNYIDMWEFKCDCGNTRICQIYPVINGKSKSCGCSKGQGLKGRGEKTFKKYEGKKINRLTPIMYIGPKGTDRTPRWLCRCECGVEKEVVNSKLLGGHTKSCGCLSKEISTRSLVRMNWSKDKVQTLYKKFIAGAATRNLEFTITLEEFRFLIAQNCVYCGSGPSNIYLRGRENSLHYNGLDRIDSSKGYTIENSASCCKFCNLFKSDMTKEDFINHVHKISDFNRVVVKK